MRKYKKDLAKPVTRDASNRVQVHLHRGQTRVWLSTKRYILVVAGRQAGKTMCGTYWLLNKITQDQTADYLIAAPTYKLLTQATLHRFLQIINVPGKWNEQRKEFMLAKGGRVFARSTEDPNSLEAMTLKAAWLDEVGAMKRAVWDKIQPRLVVNKAPLLMTTSPYYLNWVYSEVYRGYVDGTNTDIEYINFPSTANPHYDLMEAERLRRLLGEDSAEYKRSILGQFAQSESLVYHEFKRDNNVITPFTIPATWKRIAGFDFGTVNPSACIFIAISPKNELYVYKEYYKRNATFDEHSKAIHDMIDFNEDFRIYADPRASQAILELSRRGMPIQTAMRVEDALSVGQVRIGINLIKQLVRDKRLFIFNNCTNLIDEMEMYSYEAEEGQEDSNERIRKEHDHGLDAMRYAIVSNKFGIEKSSSKLWERLGDYTPKVHLNAVTGYPEDGDMTEEDKTMDLRRRFNIYPKQILERIQAKGAN